MTVTTVIASGFILFRFTHIKFQHLFYIMALEILIIFNVSFFLIRRQKNAGCFYLVVDLDEIRLLRDDKVIYSEGWEYLSMDQLAWGSDWDHSLPMIRLKGGNFPEIVIAAALDTNDKTKSGKFRSAADLIITDEKEWQRLMQTLDRVKLHSPGFCHRKSRK